MRIGGYDRLRRLTRCGAGIALLALCSCHSLETACTPAVDSSSSATASASEADASSLMVARPRFLPPVAGAEPKVLPVGLDTVFRLARDQNSQIQLARARLGEAHAGQDLARKAWLPQIDAGPSYYRHEGGIQDFQGHLIHSSFGSVFAGAEIRDRLDPRDVAFQRVDAERKVRQQKGELSKFTSENLLDAANTYLDLLTARASENLARDVEKQLAGLLKQARDLAKVDPGLGIEVERVEAEVRSHRLVLRKLREGGDAAAAKLAYLLAVDPACVVVPIDTHLFPIDLVDPYQPPGSFVAKALARGPGIRELEGLVQLIDQMRGAADGPGRYLPTLELNINEGALGAGPGSRLNWDNSLNLGMHLRWNLTEALTARERMRQADFKAAQVHLNYQDLRARLVLGVTEAHAAVLSGEDHLPIAEEQVRHSEQAYELSVSRLKESIKGRSPSEVLMAVRSLAGARLQYIQILRDRDKAQVRLFLLVGESCADRP